MMTRTEKVFRRYVDKAVLFVICLMIMSLLTGCGMTFGSPKTKEQVIKELTDGFGYQPLFVEEQVKQSEAGWLHKDFYYEFEDKNGLRFTYASCAMPQGLDGATFFYKYIGKANYKYRLIPFWSEKMEAICSKYGLEYQKNPYGTGEDDIQYDPFGNEIQFGGAMIRLEGYKDLEPAVSLMYELLDTCRNGAPDENIVPLEAADAKLRVAVDSGKYGQKLKDYSLLSEKEELSKEDIKNTLYKEYIELVKKEKIPNDLPQGLLENTCPEMLTGVFQETTYSQWHAFLIDESNPENPEYIFKLYYREPMAREEYFYVDCYNNRDMGIYNIIAQLGGTCTFREVCEEIGGPAYYGELRGREILFGFTSGEEQVKISCDGEEYFFDTTLYNVTNHHYMITLSREQMEKLFGIRITYDKLNSYFVIE